VRLVRCASASDRVWVIINDSVDDTMDPASILLPDDFDDSMLPVSEHTASAQTGSPDSSDTIVTFQSDATCIQRNKK